MDEQTAHEERMYQHYKEIADENFHLKNQLDKKNKELKKLRRLVNRKQGQKKQRYRNNGKGGK